LPISDAQKIAIVLVPQRFLVILGPCSSDRFLGALFRSVRWFLAERLETRRGVPEMTRTEITGRDAGQLGPNGSLVASVNETMIYIGVGRAKLYELLKSEIESYVEGSSRKILWPSIHAYVGRRLAAEAARRGRAA
jgi:hypothetical protein